MIYMMYYKYIKTGHILNGVIIIWEVSSWTV